MVLYNSGLTGSAKISRALAASLNSKNNDWDVEAVLPSEGATTQWLRASGVRTRIIPRLPLRASWSPLHHLTYLSAFPATVAAYRSVIQQVQPDLVHIDSLLNLPALLAAKVSGVKTLLHVQEVAYGTLRRALAAMAVMLVDRVVAVSEAAAQPLRKRTSQDEVSIVYNGVSVPEPKPPYQPRGWVTFVGRLSEDKDPISFVRAAEKVYAQYPASKFRIIGLTVPGREQYEEHLLRALRESRIPQAILVLLRDLEDVQSLLREASVLVSSSAVPESFGLAVLEAMALGIPVVAPRSGAFPEFVSDSETGLLYPSGDSEQMAACVLRLLRDPLLAENIGHAAHSAVRSRFTEQIMVAGMEKQYRLLLNSM
jgi:glycosyltransferase involved in cell wall biosynthesis